MARETPIVFQESAGDTVITLLNMLTNVARVSARHDLGAGSTADRYQWQATFQFNTAPVVGETVDLYIALSDGTLEDGDVGTVDAAVLTPVLRNLSYIGSVVVQAATLGVDFRASGICTIPSRYFSLVVHNNTADSLKNTANVNTITFTPIPPEVQ